MVGGDVCYDRDIRAALHRLELKGGKLDRGDVVGGHFFDFREQRLADVAAEEDAGECPLEQPADDGCRGGFAVGAGDADYRAGA